MSKRPFGIFILVAVFVLVTIEAYFGLRISDSPSSVSALNAQFTTTPPTPPTYTPHPPQTVAPATSLPISSTTTPSPAASVPSTSSPACKDSDDFYKPILRGHENAAARNSIVKQLETLQGPVPLDIFNGNSTVPSLSPTALPITYSLLEPQTQTDFKASIQCREVLGLPTGPDGNWLFNLGLSSGQIRASSLFLATEPISVHIYDEGVSEKGKRSSGDYVVVNQNAGPEDTLDDNELYDLKDKGKFKGRYGFSPSKVVGKKEVSSMELYAGLGRWSTFRNFAGNEPGMRSAFSITYISYISLTWYKPTADTSVSPVVRWHPLGALPTVSLSTQAALKQFRDIYFGGGGSGVREGLEDCIFIPPFATPSSSAHRESNTCQRRHFIMCGLGFSWSDAQMFIGEVTSRFERGCATNRLASFDKEWIPVMDDPAGFNVQEGDSNKHISLNKNWNNVQCDFAAIKAQQQERSSSGTPVGWVICLQTNAAPSMITVAFDMDARRVVARWESKNEANGADKLRNGKGVIPLLPHEIPQVPQQVIQNVILPATTSTTRSYPFPKNLVLFHTNKGGVYSLVWGLMDNYAPYSLLRYGMPTYSKETSSYDSSGTHSTPFHPWKKQSSHVEYVRSITLSPNREHVYFSYSDVDRKGEMCIVPLWRAVQASIGNLH